MASIYKNSKAVVHPYRAEGFGMHVQEAVVVYTVLDSINYPNWSCLRVKQ